MKNKLLRIVFYIVVSIIIGIIVGVLDALFGEVLVYFSNIRENFSPWIYIFLPFAGYGIIYMYKKYGKNASKGMSLVFQTAYGEEEKIPKRLISFSIITTWITHFFGGSAGREGVSVQIGASVASNVYELIRKKLKLNEEIKKIMISTGMAAGFSGLFGTPLAATIFSMEVLKIGTLNYSALFPTIISSYVAAEISSRLGLNHFKFKILEIPKLDYKIFLLLVISGILFGIVGYCFAYFLKWIKNVKFLKNIPPEKKIFFGGIILAIFLFLVQNGRYSGLGVNLINDSFNGNKIYNYDWFLKIIFTVFTLGIGFQGGEVTPLFSIGASLGIVLGIYFNLPLPFIAAIGYSSVFGAATNTFLASVLIGAEVFGYEMLPYLFIGCSISYIFSGQLSIYSLQKEGSHKI